MPALAFSAQTRRSAPYPFIMSLADAPDAQGLEGKKLSENAEEVLRHCRDCAGAVVALTESTDLFSYDHIPLMPVFFVKTRYKFIGRMKPRSFPMSE